MDSVPGRPCAAPSPCQHCGGECEAQFITLTLRCSQYTFAVVRNVPADVCQICGESQFTMLTTGRLLSLVQPDRKPDEVVLIPIYDFASAS